MRAQFKDTVVDLAKSDPRIVMVFGDISVYLFRDFWQQWPERFFNAGICENTLVSMAAGLSSQGFHPFVHTITPFLTDRSYEQIKLDLCYNEFGANLLSCGASFDYAWDGATHHCYTELAMLRRLPGMEVMQPGSKHEMDVLLRSQYANGKPSYYRIAHDEHGEAFTPEFGKGIIVRDAGADVTVVTAGPILGNVLKACEDLSVNILYYHTLKPFDYDVLARFRDTRILVVHDAFGLHEAVMELPDLRVRYYGLPDQFNCFYGTLNDIRGDLGLDPAGIRQAVVNRIDEIQVAANSPTGAVAMVAKSPVAVSELRDAGTKNWLLNHSAFAGSAYGKSLKSQPLGFIDIGARGGVSSIVEPIAAATAVLGFEPNESEAQALRDAHAASPVYQSFDVRCAAVAGTTGTRDFYETARGVNSSLLRPSDSFASRYQVPGFAIENISSCQTDTLDNIIFEANESAAPYGEFLKLDVQGAELEVLQGAGRVLSERTVAVIAEVSFCELYENQPLFGDVASYLKSKGFGFYGFHAMSHRASHLRHLLNNQNSAWSQRLIQGDAIFFREDLVISRPLKASFRARAVLTCVALLLGYYDFADELHNLNSGETVGQKQAFLELLEQLASKSPRKGPA